MQQVDEFDKVITYTISFVYRIFYNFISIIIPYWEKLVFFSHRHFFNGKSMDKKIANVKSNANVKIKQMI